MSSSPTPNAATWTHGLFTTLLSDIQLSASLAERTTLMAVLTSTLSWISADALTSGTRDALMLRASTRTFNHVVEHHKRCSTMRSRTETLSLEDSTPLSTLQYRDLVMSGLELQMPTVDEFWDLARAGSTSATLQPPVPPSLRRVALSTRGCCIPTPRYPSTQHCRSSGTR